MLAETGDSWFNCQKLKLPNGCRCRRRWRLILFLAPDPTPNPNPECHAASLVLSVLRRQQTSGPLSWPVMTARVLPAAQVPCSRGSTDRQVAMSASLPTGTRNAQPNPLASRCNARYEFQCQYGSIGWAVGATLGYSIGLGPKRLIASIGDGSFQVHVGDLH